MRLFLATVCALVFCAAPAAHATGASCNVTPNPLHVLQQGTLSAAALPTVHLGRVSASVTTSG